jgi:ATP-grasp domain
MKSEVVVVVDPFSSGRMIAPALRHQGYSPLSLITSSYALEQWGSTYRAADFDHDLRYDGDLDKTLAQLRALSPIAILPGMETGVELCDLLAPELTPDRANLAHLASARRHKGHMEQAVAQAGIPTIRSISARSPAEVEQWLTRQGLRKSDLIFKPVDSAGTDGLTFVPAGEGWHKAFDGLHGTRNRLGLLNQEVMVQEYVTGTEYAVDTFSYDGKHTVNDITRYTKVRNAGHIAVYDSMEFLPYDAPGHAEIIEYTGQVLDALGIRFGAAHTEVMVTDRGPLLIETGARLGGGGQPAACQLATGDDPIDRTVRYLSGDRDIRHDFTLEMWVQVVFFVAPTSGRIHNTAALKTIRDLASCCQLTINVQDDDRISATSCLDDSYNYGVVILGSDDRDQVEADYAAVRGIERQVIIDE